VAVGLVIAGLGAIVVGEGGPRALAPAPGRALVYAALGDSTVAGVGASAPARSYVGHLHARLREVFPAAHLVNLGVSGATAADVVAAQLPRAVALQPCLVTLSVGPNDITTGRDVRQYARDLDVILGPLARRTPAVLVVNLIPDLALTPRFRGGEPEAAVGGRTMAFNAAPSRAARRHGAEVVDLYALSRREVPRRPDLIAADGYHPSDAGYARWAEAMWQGLRSRIGRD